MIRTWKSHVFSSSSGFFFLERGTSEFLSEDFGLCNIGFCTSCTDATWGGRNFPLTGASEASARPSARVSRRVRKLSCGRDAGSRRDQRERRRVRYNPESHEYFCSTNNFKTPPDRVLPETSGNRPPCSLLLSTLLMRRRLAVMKMGPTAEFEIQKASRLETLCPTSLRRPRSTQRQSKFFLLCRSGRSGNEGTAAN